MNKTSKKTELILCIFGGCIGLHKFYRKQIGMGILYFLTWGLLGIGWIADIISLAVNYNKDGVNVDDVDIDKIVYENQRDRRASIRQYRKMTGENKKNASKKIDAAYKRQDINPRKKVCPKCKSDNCTVFLSEKEVKPQKKITRHSINLNPLHPFTFINSNEKVTRKSVVKTESKFVCNDCGKIFK